MEKKCENYFSLGTNHQPNQLNRPGHIMTTLEWVENLKGAMGSESQLPAQWMSDDTAEFVRRGWRDVIESSSYIDAFTDENVAIIDRCIPLALLGSKKRTLSSDLAEMVLVADPERPDKAFVSLATGVPALLWCECEPTLDGLLDHLQPYLAERKLVEQMSKTAKTVKVLNVERDVIENHIVRSEFWLDDGFWCSSYVNNPWENPDLEDNVLMRSVMLEERMKEHRGRMPSTSFRALWSGGVITIEAHPFGVYRFFLRYEPANDAHAIRTVNELTHGDLPLDLPVDIAASLLRGENVNEKSLQEMKPTGPWLDYAALSSAYHYGDSTGFYALMEMIDDADEAKLDAVSRVAEAYQQWLVCEHIIMRYPDSPTAQELHTYSKPVPPEAAQ